MSQHLGRKGLHHVDVGEKILDTENGKCKGPGAEILWQCWKNITRPEGGSGVRNAESRRRGSPEMETWELGRQGRQVELGEHQP